MKVLLDNLQWTDKGGIFIYFQELIKTLKHNNIPFETFVYNDMENNDQIVIPKKNRFLERFRKCKIKSSKYDIYHSSYYRLPSCKNTKIVTTVHDFTHQKYFNIFSSLINLVIKLRSFRKSHALVCISENTKKDLLTFYRPKEWQSIHVIYNGISNDYFMINPQSYNYKNYFLYVGSRSGYKNWPLALDILKKNKSFKLVVVGGSQDKDSFYKKIDKELIKQIDFRGFVTNQELNELYNEAFCLFYPSSYEGFGIPAIEAMAAGCPVIANNTCEVFKEIAHKEIIFFDQKKENDHILKFELLKKYNRKNLIINGLKKSKEFSWTQSTNKLLDVYRGLSN